MAAAPMDGSSQEMSRFRSVTAAPIGRKILASANDWGELPFCRTAKLQQQCIDYDYKRHIAVPFTPKTVPEEYLLGWE
jgi:hypothetical protein